MNFTLFLILASAAALFVFGAWGAWYYGKYTRVSMLVLHGLWYVCMPVALPVILWRKRNRK